MSRVAPELYLQLYSTSPAPRRDYHGLTITKQFITLNSWDISHGPHVFPRRLRTPLAELDEDEVLQRDILGLFGKHVLEYALLVARGDILRLHTLPHRLFLAVLRLLASNDIIRLGQTSKMFFELCNTNPVWKILYRKKTKRPLTNQVLSQAERQTWKYLLKKKLSEKLNTIGITENFRNTCPLRPDKEIIERVDMYSNTMSYKKRSPPVDDVPKLDIDIDFISLKHEKEKKSKSLYTLPSTKNDQKKTVTIMTPKTQSILEKSSKSPLSKTPPKWTSMMETAKTKPQASCPLSRRESSPSLKAASPKKSILSKKFSSPLLSDRTPVLEESSKSPFLKTLLLTDRSSTKSRNPFLYDDTSQEDKSKRITRYLKCSADSTVLSEKSPKNTDLITRRTSSPSFVKNVRSETNLKVKSENALHTPKRESPKKSSQTSLVKPKSRVLN